MINSDNFTILVPLIIIIVIIGLVVDRLPIGRHFPSTVLVMIIAIILTNTGITPNSSSVYDFVFSDFVPLGIVLLLFNARLDEIVSEIRPIILSFFIAVVATLTGVFAAVVFMDFGELEASIAGVFAGTYIGGAMNFVAVSQVVGLTDPDVYASALAADTAVGAVFFITLVLLSMLVPRETENPIDDDAAQTAPDDTYRPTNLFALGVTLVIAFAVTKISGPIAEALYIGKFSILVMTIIAIAIANLLPNQIKRISGIDDIGVAIMFTFFVVVGLGANMSSLTGPALEFVFFAAIILGIHVILLTVVWKVFKLPLRELLIASNACVLGPATAAGMAASRGWIRLVTPGLVAGVFGYAIASFIGTGVATLLGWR
jgi:uncharacterized membrane protein